MGVAKQPLGGSISVLLVALRAPFSGKNHVNSCEIN